VLEFADEKDDRESSFGRDNQADISFDELNRQQPIVGRAPSRKR
jgi:hypothetical protein